MSETTSGSAAEIDAIRRVVTAREAAWNGRDIDAMVAGLAEQCDSIDSHGRESTGRDALRKRYAELFASPMYKDVKSRQVVGRVRVIAPGAAVADGDWTITGLKGTDGAAAPDRSGHSTLVLVKAGDRWEIVAIRSFTHGAADK
jgi:uncharacterized protein (TIGR02246 family)